MMTPGYDTGDITSSVMSQDSHLCWRFSWKLLLYEITTERACFCTV